MITTNDLSLMHDALIDAFGGSKGIRDQGLLDASAARPFATFDGVDLYPTPIDKASAIFESLVINHPFMDGNKRIAYVALRLMLLNHNIDLNVTQDEKYKMVIAASSGSIRFDEIKDWITSHITISK